MCWSKMKKILIIVFGLLILLTIFWFSAFKVFLVSGISMEPTLTNNEKILVYRKAYLFSKPHRGDIVLVSADNQIFVKRIIATGGQLIEIKDGKVFLNGEIIDEPYAKNSYTFGNQNIVLPEDHYYVLGDNREPNESTDSRIFGPINKENILGKVIYNISDNFSKI